MTTAAHDTVVKVADLIDRPGASRRVDLALPVPADLELPLADVRGLLRLNGVVESVVDGLLVRGTLEADLGVACARCLTDVDSTVRAEVAELFTDPKRHDVAPEDADPGYEVVDGELNLDTLLRDALVPSVPLRPLCDEACAGLCASCGQNRNEGACDCADDASDQRWAALRALDLPAD